MQEDYEKLSREVEYSIELELESARQFFNDGNSKLFNNPSKEQPKFQSIRDSDDGREKRSKIYSKL